MQSNTNFSLSTWHSSFLLCVILLFSLLLQPTLSGPITCSSQQYLNLNSSACVTSCPPFSHPSQNVCQCNAGYYLSLDQLTCLDACPSNQQHRFGLNCATQVPSHTCRSCPEAICQVALSLDGLSCVESSCPENSTAQPTAAGVQCVCEYGYSLTLQKDACVLTCPNAEYSWKRQCVTSCPENTELNLNSTDCQCKLGHVLSLDGLHCLNQCEKKASSLNGVCRCDAGYDLGSDRESCIKECAKGEYILNGTCRGSCPVSSRVIPNTSECLCYEVLSINKETCLSVCPTGMLMIGKVCMCESGKYLSEDGYRCVAECTRGSLNGQCIESCPEGSKFDSVLKACMCSPETYQEMDGLTCVTKCGEGEVSVDGICMCGPDYLLSANRQKCVKQCGQGEYRLGRGCFGKCPEHSKLTGGAECSCQRDNPMSLDELSCVPRLRGCGEYAVEVEGRCRCSTGFYATNTEGGKKKSGEAATLGRGFPICKRCGFNCVSCDDGQTCNICEREYTPNDEGECVKIKDENESMILTKDTMTGLVCLVIVIGLCWYAAKRTMNSAVEAERMAIEFQDMVEEVNKKTEKKEETKNDKGKKKVRQATDLDEESDDFSY